MAFQIWDSVVASQRFVTKVVTFCTRNPSLGPRVRARRGPTKRESPARSQSRPAGPLTSNEFEERLRIFPLPGLELERTTLVDQNLAVVRQGNPEPFERTWRRPFEVDPGHVETAPVARALELVLGFQPVRSAAQLGTDRLNRIDPFLFSDDPHSILFLEPFVNRAYGEVVREPHGEGGRWLGQNVGKEETAHGDATPRRAEVPKKGRRARALPRHRQLYSPGKKAVKTSRSPNEPDGSSTSHSGYP